MTASLGAVEPGTALHAGAAAYNAGVFRAAQGILAAPETTLLDGLAAFAGTVANARTGNWSEAVELADRASRQLAAADPTTQGVETARLQRWLGAFHADPERIERTPAPSISVEGETPVPETLPFDAAGVAAVVVAESTAYDEGVVADAVRLARAEADPDESPYGTFLRDFVGEAGHRPIVFERLSGMVEQERRKERDVGGLFEERDEE